MTGAYLLAGLSFAVAFAVADMRAGERPGVVVVGFVLMALFWPIFALMFVAERVTARIVGPGGWS